MWTDNEKHIAWAYKLKDKQNAMVSIGPPRTKDEAYKTLMFNYGPERIEWVRPNNDVIKDRGE